MSDKWKGQLKIAEAAKQNRITKFSLTSAISRSNKCLFLRCRCGQRMYERARGRGLTALRCEIFSFPLICAPVFRVAFTPSHRVLRKHRPACTYSSARCPWYEETIAQHLTGVMSLSVFYERSEGHHFRSFIACSMSALLSVTHCWIFRECGHRF